MPSSQLRRGFLWGLLMILLAAVTWYYTFGSDFRGSLVLATIVWLVTGYGFYRLSTKGVRWASIDNDNLVWQMQIGTLLFIAMVLYKYTTV